MTGGWRVKGLGFLKRGVMNMPWVLMAVSLQVKLLDKHIRQSLDSVSGFVIIFPVLPFPFLSLPFPSRPSGGVLQRHRGYDLAGGGPGRGGESSEEERKRPRASPAAPLLSSPPLLLSSSSPLLGKSNPDHDSKSQQAKRTVAIVLQGKEEKFLPTTYSHTVIH